MGDKTYTDVVRVVGDRDNDWNLKVRPASDWRDGVEIVICETGEEAAVLSLDPSVAHRLAWALIACADEVEEIAQVRMARVRHLRVALDDEDDDEEEG